MEHGGIGAKAFASIERTIEQELAQIPPITTPVAELGNSDLIGMVPLFRGLPDEVLTEIAREAHVVTFLIDDTVIGEGEHGNALYIIVRGEVGVYHQGENGREKQLAVLGPGDFFGEIALLGDSVRTANVRALKESSLLRITRKTITKLSGQHPVVAGRLEEERRIRTHT